jgi:hypothetical protein
VLQPLDGWPSFQQLREPVRRVQADCAIAVDANSYSDRGTEFCGTQSHEYELDADLS